jgi:hypothetical protein
VKGGWASTTQAVARRGWMKAWTAAGVARPVTLPAQRSAPQASQVSVWPPRVAVRQAAIARSARCCPRVKRWVARYAAPGVRTRPASSLRRLTGALATA